MSSALLASFQARTSILGILISLFSFAKMVCRLRHQSMRKCHFHSYLPVYVLGCHSSTCTGAILFLITAEVCQNYSDSHQKYAELSEKIHH